MQRVKEDFYEVLHRRERRKHGHTVVLVSEHRAALAQRHASSEQAHAGKQLHAAGTLWNSQNDVFMKWIYHGLVLKRAGCITLLLWSHSQTQLP